MTFKINRNLSIEAKNYWSSSSQKEIIKDYSHWKGVGRWENELEWGAIGINHFNMFNDVFKQNNIDNKVMLEWGPGGGSNVLAFSKIFNKIYGVDISNANLQECSKQINSVNEKISFCPVLLNNPEKPNEILIKLKEKIDFFLSTAVYQHFPSKEYGFEVTRLCYEIMNKNGLGIIQIRYDSKEKGFFSKTKNYSKDVLTFTSYKIEEFWKILLKTGFQPISIYLQPKTNYAYYFFTKE